MKTFSRLEKGLHSNQIQSRRANFDFWFQFKTKFTAMSDNHDGIITHLEPDILDVKSSEP